MKIYNALIESCLIFLIIFTPLAYGAVQPWSAAVFQTTAALAVLFWIFKMLKEGNLEFIHTPVILFILLFTLYISLQLFLSRHTTYDIRYTTVYFWATKTELLKVISYALIFFVTLNTIKTRRQIERVLSVIIAAGFAMSIFFLMRYFGVKAPRGIINSDHFSGYLGMIIPLALGLIFVRYTTYGMRPLLFFTVIVMSAALFFTMSRGGMFSFIAALLFMAGLVLTRRAFKKKGWLLSAVVILIILTIAWLGAVPVVERILSIEAEIASLSFGGRLPIWQGTINIIKDYSLFGTGLGTFNYIFPKYQPEALMVKHYTYAHSDFLELLSEVGIAGFIIFLSGLIAFAIYTVRRFSRRHDPYVIGISIGIFGSLASIFVHSFTDFNLHIPANAVLLAIILALCIAVLNYRGDNVPAPDTVRYTLPAMRYTRYPLYALTSVIIAVFILTCSMPAIACYCAMHRTPGNLRLATALDFADASYHYRLGKEYLEGARTLRSGPEAIKLASSVVNEYRQAVNLNPTNSRYRQSLAWSYGLLSDLYTRHTTYDIRYARLAHREFREAISLQPNNPYRRRAYAMWLFSHPTEENIEKGAIEYRKAVYLEPKFAKEALAAYYKYQKDYKKLIDILPSSEDSDYVILGFLIKEKGLSFAIDFADEFLKTYPYNARMHFWIADRSFYDKDYSWEFTEKHYRIAFKNDPENGYYRMWHGIHLYYRQEYKEAIKELKAAIDMGLSPENEKQAEGFMEKVRNKIGRRG